ncbi:MAG TPA: hypothetical protein VMM60_09075 [Ilumatobacter sp.]|nr:hypothetical protein [Ilumatobacter sp.]
MDTRTTNPAWRLHAELSAIDASWRQKPKERMKGVVLPDPPADLLGFVASMARTGREVVQALEATDADVLPRGAPAA